jgi:hypothetical protein
MDLFAKAKEIPRQADRSRISQEASSVEPGAGVARYPASSGE